MRRAVTAALFPCWLVGALTASVFSLFRWAGAAAADGWSSTIRLRWGPALGLLTLAAAVTVLVLVL